MQRTKVERLKRTLIAKATDANYRLSPDLALLWEAFVDLSHSGRSYSAFGANPILFTEIEAYMRICRVPLDMHHIRAICAADLALRTLHQNLEPPKKPELTAAAFDALNGIS